MRRIIAVVACFGLFAAGCTMNVYKTTPKDRMTIQQLEGEVGRLSEMRASDRIAHQDEIARLHALREEERKEFEKILLDLQGKLKDGRVGLDVQERGLVITLADNILFDSGKAKIKEDAFPTLDEIIMVIKTTAVNKNIGIEGHTDNVPIKYSGWKSNRELSTARANNVYHYLVDKGVSPARMTTMGYGEYRPVASNDTDEGRAENRRVEIVILPEFTKSGDATPGVNQADTSFVK